jgi:tRNA methyl transferase
MYKLSEKEQKLFEYIKKFADKKIVVAFSGGVDSSLVLKIARETTEKSNVIAVTFNTILHPKNDIKIVKNLAKDFDVDLHIVEINEIKNDKILYNDVKRCYHCKRDIFEKIISLKDSLGFGYIIDGSNYDDCFVYRPGKVALKELGVISPLMDMKFTKKEVRILADKINISVANRPSKPCMMTRMPYNKKVDMSRFSALEIAEEYLSSLGFANNRVRLYDDVTRIEVEVEKIPLFFEKRSEIIKKFKELGFVYINLDMEGFRSGSMDIVIQDKNSNINL